jgi:hypothetical protein
MSLASIAMYWIATSINASNYINIIDAFRTYLTDT